MAANDPDEKVCPYRTTVLLVNKNHGHYLGECLHSLQGHPVTCVVRDGRSNDASAEIAAQFKDVLFESSPDGGSNEAFARGLLAINSDFVSFLTSTDYLRDPDWVSIAQDALERAPEVAMVVGGVVGVADGLDTSYRWPLRKLAQRSHEAVFFDWLFFGEGFTPISIVMRTSVAKECLHPLSDFEGPDSCLEEDFFWRLSRNFFSRRFVAEFVGPEMVNGRLHSDRRQDEAWLPAQQARLHDFIRRERRRMLRGFRSIEFIDPYGKRLPRRRISYYRLTRAWIASLALRVRSAYFGGSRDRTDVHLRVYGTEPARMRRRLRRPKAPEAKGPG